MSIRQELQHSIKSILAHSREGSFATQHTREQLLMNVAKDIVTLGFGLKDVRGLKQKHIVAVVKHWQDTKISIASIKNRTSALRMLCAKINKANIVPKNDDLNIGKRQYISTVNKAIYNPDFSKISNPYIRVSVELQRVFGLRREEALKIKPHLADQGHQLQLFPSWCKGGRGRFVPIRTEEQRYWLNRAKELAGDSKHSLIPAKKNYIQHRYVYDKQVLRAGLRNLHGLRYAYAQQRYKELTGWDAPFQSGRPTKLLSVEQREKDILARMLLTEEMGHSRSEIIKNYCG